jgi:hypothetical protein
MRYRHRQRVEARRLVGEPNVSSSSNRRRYLCSCYSHIQATYPTEIAPGAKVTILSRLNRRRTFEPISGGFAVILKVRVLGRCHPRELRPICANLWGSRKCGWRPITVRLTHAKLESAHPLVVTCRAARSSRVDHAMFLVVGAVALEAPVQDADPLVGQLSDRLSVVFVASFQLVVVVALPVTATGS